MRLLLFVFPHLDCSSSNKSTSSDIYLFLPLGSWFYNLLWAGRSLKLCEPRNSIGIAWKVPAGIKAKYRGTHMPVCHHEQIQHQEWALFFFWFQLTQEFPEGNSQFTQWAQAKQEVWSSTLNKFPRHGLRQNFMWSHPISQQSSDKWKFSSVSVLPHCPSSLLVSSIFALYS